MAKFKYKFLMLEFDLDQVYRYPRIPDVPRRLWDKIKVSLNLLLNAL